MTRLLREPLLHFTLIGLLIWGLYGIFGDTGDSTDDERTVRLSAAEMQWIAGNFSSRWNRPPTRQEFDGLLQQRLKEEVLYREALAMGLDEGDQVIRRRLAQKLEFVVSDLASAAEPERVALEAWFEARREDYALPPRYTLTQIYLDPDRRGDGVLEEAERLRDELNAQAAPPADPRTLGDSLMLDNEFAGYSPAELSRQFGRGFVDSLIALEPGRWHAPVLSGYGVHVVRIAEVVEPPPPVFDEISERVMQDWLQATREELNEAYVDNLMASYEIVVEEAIVPLLEPPGQGGERASGNSVERASADGGS